MDDYILNNEGPVKWLLKKSAAIKLNKADKETAEKCYQELKTFARLYNEAQSAYTSDNTQRQLEALYSVKHSFCTLIASNFIYDCYSDKIKSILEKADRVLESIDKKNEKSSEKKFSKLQDDLYFELTYSRFYETDSLESYEQAGADEDDWFVFSYK